ncbi:MAG TPA: fibronectin type III domain-containing protein [Acidimicrobiia bacterium]|nr:fibronectin type III domain-containing protein [Acidimicrobiia bacterium]
MSFAVMASLVLTGVVVAASSANASAPLGQFAEFTVPTPSSGPAALALGSDGNFWFPEQFANQIARMTPGAPNTVTEFPVPGAGSSPAGITAGPDGNLWFTEELGNKIGRITPGAPNTITEFTVPTPGGYPTTITAGPDGNLWFTELNGNKIGRITPGAPNAITEFTIPTAASGPITITAGPDGNLWFAERAVNKIGRITPGAPNTITEFTVPTAGSLPESITAGPDGNLWFTELNGNNIGRITPGAPNTVTEFTIPTAASQPVAIMTGSDGNLWFTENAPTANNIGRITPGAPNTITEAQIPTASSTPAGMAVGPDGNVWFTEFDGNKLARIGTGAPDPPTSAAGTAGVGQVTVSWSAPVNSGGSPVTGYTVTASPGGQQCVWVSGPLQCTVSGLTNGSSYTFTVVATNNNGNSLPSAPSAPVTPGAVFPAGGSFVIGNESATVGNNVMFWGAQWSTHELFLGATPKSFKGFANNPAGAATCGTQWSTNPGNSSGPPATVPAYMAVIVTSSINQNGSVITGNITGLAIVKTDPGYAGNPGHAGTGTIIAVLPCP